MLWSLILIVVVSLFLCACSAGDDTEEKNNESRDSQLYEDIKKSIVRLEIDKSAGSGIVWSIEDGKIIIVSSRHLIEQGDKPTVIVYDGTRFDAMTEGSSDISDVGFLSIEYENRENGTNDDILNKINAVCPRIYEDIQSIREENEELADNDRSKSTHENGRLEVVQIASSAEPAGDLYTGYTEGIAYVPELGEKMLQTRCYSKAGMSGGGVFDNEGFLIGMISAGDVDSSETENRDADITYSIPVEIIESAYTELRNSKTLNMN